MTYEKPEMTVLGDAAQLVQHSKVSQPLAEAPLNKAEIGAAYETEE
jgi:hypothetical protein